MVTLISRLISRCHDNVASLQVEICHFGHFFLIFLTSLQSLPHYINNIAEYFKVEKNGIVKTILPIFRNLLLFLIKAVSSYKF